MADPQGRTAMYRLYDRVGKKFGVPLLRKSTVVSINAPADDA